MSKDSKIAKAAKILKEHGVKISKKDLERPQIIMDKVKELGYAYDEQGQEFYNVANTATINFKFPEYIDGSHFLEYIAEKIAEYEDLNCQLMNEIKITPYYDFNSKKKVDGVNRSYLMYKIETVIDNEILDGLIEDE